MPDSINPELRQVQTGGIAQGDMGGPTATSQIGQQRARQVDTTQWGPDVVGGLLGFAENISKQAWVDQTERTYAEAARARQLGESMESVEGNVFLKPFIRGGFQDMDFQLRQAEMQTTAQKFIAKDGRKVPPEQFQAYLQEHTKSLWDSTGSGLSRQMRKQALDSTMKAEGSLMATHSKEYQKYLNEENYKMMTAMATTSLAGVQALQGGDTMPALQELAGVMQRLHTDLPAEQSNPMLQKLMQTMYRDGMIEEADALFEGGENGTGITGTWPVEVRYEVANAQRAAYDKRLTEVNTVTATEIAAARSQHKAGKVFTPNEIHAMSPEARGVLNNKGLAALMIPEGSTGTPDKNLAMASLYIKGSPALLNQNMFNATESGNAAYTFTKGQFPESPVQFVSAVMPANIAHGYIQPELVKDLDRSIGNILGSSDGSGSQYDQDMMNTFVNMYRAHANEGSGTAILALIDNGLSEDNRGVLTAAMMDKTGRPLPALIADAKARIDTGFAMKVKDRVQSTKNEQRILTNTEAMLESDVSNAMWRTFKSITGLGTQEVPKGSKAYQQILDATLEETQYIFIENPGLANGLPDESIHAMALARAANRTVMVTVDVPMGFDYNRALVLPRQPNGKVKFLDTVNTLPDGNRLNASPEAVQRALMTELNVPKGHSVEFSTPPNGDVIPVFIDTSNPTNVIQGKPINPKNVQDLIMKERGNLEQVVADSQFGMVYRAHDATAGRDLNLNINGLNVQGLPAEKVLEWRKELIKSEGVREQQYTDTTGNITVGIGHKVRPDMQSVYSSTTKDGVMSTTGISDLFASDSDFAITEGARIARDYGISDPDTQLAIAEMVFQLGSAGTKEFKATLKQLADANDFEGLKTRSRDWPWYAQTPKRVDKFLNAIQPIFED